MLLPAIFFNGKINIISRFKDLQSILVRSICGAFRLSLRNHYSKVSREKQCIRVSFICHPGVAFLRFLTTGESALPAGLLFPEVFLNQEANCREE